MILEESKVYIKKSQIKGKGLFAKKEIKKGEIIFEIKGNLFLVKEEKKFNKKIIDNSFRYSFKKSLCPSREWGNFLNHSCNSNSFVQKIKNKLYLIAFQKIKKDSEITLDYSTILARDDSWKMNCVCGNKNCRKVISRFNFLPKNVLKKYLSLELIPDYILKID